MSENITRTTNGRPYEFCVFIRQKVINLVGTDVLGGPFRLTYFHRKRRERAPTYVTRRTRDLHLIRQPSAATFSRWRRLFSVVCDIVITPEKAFFRRLRHCSPKVRCKGCVFTNICGENLESAGGRPMVAPTDFAYSSDKMTLIS